MMDSSGIPPLINPRSPMGLHSMVGANPGLHLHVNAPGLLMHSVEARSHWLDAHSFMSAQKRFCYALDQKEIRIFCVHSVNQKFRAISPSQVGTLSNL